MKHLLTGMTTLLLMAITLPSIAQCDDEAFLDNCAQRLDDFTFLKAYKLTEKEIKDGKKTKGVEYSYVFSKETMYKLTVCDNKESDSKMIVNLYDRNRKLIASNYDRKTKRSYPSIGYKCKATGVYYLTYNFKGADDSWDGCGVSILGFNK